MAEQFSMALLLTTFGVLLAISVVSGRVSERLGLPAVLVFLLIGMMAGSDGIGGIEFSDYRLAFHLGSAALAFILFDGGLNTPLENLKVALWPSVLLATAGVFVTAGLLAVIAHWLGFDWPAALLLGSVVSSTDAAAVFSILRGSGVRLGRRVRATLEAESGFNDPLAVMLTITLTRNLMHPGSQPLWRIPIDAALQLAIGAAIGLAVGFLGRAVLARLHLGTTGLYPVMTIALACMAFGAPILFFGSGFLSVYVAGLVLGNGPIPIRAGVLRVHDAVAWMSQITMFLVLGLLVFPSRLPSVAWTGLSLAVFLSFLVRPLAVGLCLLPFGFRIREIAYIGLVGLRGAVPIVLATFPVLAGAAEAERLFNVVFFIVVVNAVVPGGVLPWLACRLGLLRAGPPPPPALLSVDSVRPLNGELASFYITEGLAVSGASLADVPMPPGASVALIVRGSELVPPRGRTLIQPGDHVYVFARHEDMAAIHLLFGRPQA